MKTLTLLSGTRLTPDFSGTLILPEDHSDLNPGELVALETEKREALGTAIIVSVFQAPFAHLQQYHFRKCAHDELTSWHAAAEALARLVPGFSITDPATVIGIDVETLLEPSLMVGAATPSDAEEVFPPEEEVYAAMDESFGAEVVNG